MSTHTTRHGTYCAQCGITLTCATDKCWKCDRPQGGKRTSATILKIPNEPHVKKIHEARLAVGLPVNLMVHPFAWMRRVAA